MDVEETVSRLVRYAWINKRLMDYGLYWLNPTPEWEIKEGLSLHTYLATEHAAPMRRRVSEMRNPPPRMDVPPDTRLERFLNEVLAAQTTLEKLVAVYVVLRPALLAAYREHYAVAHRLVDYPTRRLLRSIIMEEEETIAWGSAAVDALGGAGQVSAWCAHLTAYLDAAGGISGLGAQSDDVPASRLAAPFKPDFHPRRDARFVQQENFVFPPHAVARMEGVSDEEKTLALMCKRTLEMDVPEVMAREFDTSDPVYRNATAR
jgi:bacterioferritin (cytochrome b1)